MVCRGDDLFNVIEAAVALSEGVRVSSAAAVAWHFAGRDPEAREKIALRIIAFSFFGLAAYVTVDAIRSLLGIGEARHSTIGIMLATASLIIMPVLSWGQRRAGRELGSLSAVADSKQTLLCTCLSAVLLVGPVPNSLLGWSWADPIAGLVIAGIAVKEGVDAWRGDACCAAPSHGTTADRAPQAARIGLKKECADIDCAPTTLASGRRSADPRIVNGIRRLRRTWH